MHGFAQHIAILARHAEHRWGVMRSRVCMNQLELGFLSFMHRVPILSERNSPYICHFAQGQRQMISFAAHMVQIGCKPVLPLSSFVGPSDAGTVSGQVLHALCDAYVSNQLQSCTSTLVICGSI